jgi:UDP-glucose 4-epimerase
MIRAAVGEALMRRGRGGPLPAPEHGQARPGDLRSNLVDASRASELLGWRPTVSLDAGLSLTAEWFADRIATEA